MAQGIWKQTANLIDAAEKILEVEAPVTLRQLFYRLVSSGALANTRADYQRLSLIMTGARERNEIQFESIVDRSRPVYAPNVFDDVKGYLEAVSWSYRRDLWQDQPTHCEIWTEKDALTGSIQNTANDLGVTIRVGRGFLSATKAHEIAVEFSKIKKPIHVFYLGDHDPSGRCIEAELYARIQRYGSGPFKLRRLAIHKGDISRFNLPPLRIKQSDSRAVAFLANHGTQCVEVDAVPPSELRRRINEAVKGLIDKERWDRAVAVEQVEHQSIRDAVASWPGASA